MPQDYAEVGEAQGGGDAAEVEYYGGVVGGRIRRRQRIGRQKCADPFWGYYACVGGIDEVSGDSPHPDKGLRPLHP